MITKKTLSRLRETKTIGVGGAPVDSMASLCISSPGIDLAAVTKSVGCSPTKSHVKGDLPKPKSKFPAKTALWRLDAPAELGFVEKIEYLLGATTGDLSTWKALAADHDLRLSCAIFLHSWNEGFDLGASLMLEIGRREWRFGLSIYSAEGDEILDAFLSSPS